MDQHLLIEGLINFLAFVAFVTLHEFAHAWTAVRCGDDTPRLQGRLTIDPFAHIDLVGTIILPLGLVLLSAASGGHAPICGWGKPVQVNLNNLHVRRRDDMLVSFAGPFMNLIIAVVMLGVMRLGIFVGIEALDDITLINVVRLSVFLCFFNLLPIPPLDGAHILRNFLNISDEVYAQISQYSFMFFLIILRVPAISQSISLFSSEVTILIARVFGWHLVLA
jgi:Zn-dependent protease